MMCVVTPQAVIESGAGEVLNVDIGVARCLTLVVAGDEKIGHYTGRSTFIAGRVIAIAADRPYTSDNPCDLETGKVFDRSAATPRLGTECFNI